MKSAGVHSVFTWMILILWYGSGPSASAQRTSLLGKIQDIGPRGITVVPDESHGHGARKTHPIDKSGGMGEEPQPVFVAAGYQTQVRMNILATPDKIRPGAYVEMRVLWDGKSELRATSIKFPEGIATKFGLYKG